MAWYNRILGVNEPKKKKKQAYRRSYTGANTGRLFISRVSAKKLLGFRIRLTNEDNTLIGLQTNFTAILTFRKYKIVEDKTETAIKELIRLERLKMLKKEI